MRPVLLAHLFEEAINPVEAAMKELGRTICRGCDKLFADLHYAGAPDWLGRGRPIRPPKPDGLVHVRYRCSCGCSWTRTCDLDEVNVEWSPYPHP